MTSINIYKLTVDNYENCYCDRYKARNNKNGSSN